jgi:hypothetical protein
MARLCMSLILLLSLVLAVPAEEKVKEVVAEGAGTTAREAEEDAIRAAVRQVVGAYISAETLVKNDKLIEDKILSASDGFVKSYKVVKTRKQGSLVRVTIRATVMQEKLHARLEKFRSTFTDIPNQVHIKEAISDAAVEKMTKEEARRQKTKLLHDVLLDYPKVLFAQAGQPDEFDYDKDAAKLVVDVGVLPDMKAYDRWLKRLQARLNKINQGTVTAKLTATAVDLENHVDLTLPKKKVPGWNCQAEAPWQNAGPVLDKLLDSWCLWVLTHASAKHDKTTWTGYVLDADLEKSLRGLYGHLVVQVDLLDGEGVKVASDEFSIEEGQPSWLGRMLPRLRSGYDSVGRPDERALLKAVHPGQVRVSNTQTRNIYLAPYLIGATYGGNGLLYAPSRTFRREISLKPDEWKKVKKIRSTLGFRADKLPRE